MWLLTRPFVYLVKLLKTVIAAPYRTVRAGRRHSDHRKVKSLVKEQKAR